MAATIIVPGACTVKVDTGSSHALETLGLTVGGVQIEEEIYTGEVKGDENGGEEGPPIDIQYFGEVHRVTLELNKTDMAVLAKVLPGLYGGTEGVTGTPGSLLSAGGLYYRLLLASALYPRNYLRAFLRGPAKSCNRSTKHAVQRLVFECHAWGGTLYNTTIS